jgi:hypothetical protein
VPTVWLALAAILLVLMLPGMLVLRATLAAAALKLDSS